MQILIMLVEVAEFSTSGENSGLDDSVRQWCEEQSGNAGLILEPDYCLKIARDLAESGLDLASIFRQLARENGETVLLPDSIDTSQKRLVQEEFACPTNSFADPDAPLSGPDRVAATREQYIQGASSFKQQGWHPGEIADWLRQQGQQAQKNTRG